MSRFDALAAAGALEPIDLHLGRLLQRSAGGEDGDVVALTAALLSRQRSRGHSCIHLADWAGRPFPAEGPGALPALPDLESWSRSLAASALVGDGDGSTPLVRDDGGRLYLGRYWHAEKRLAGRLIERLAGSPPAVDAARLAPLFRRLFPPPDTAAADWQSVAAAVALAGRVALVSGGPGTGKTTTVARVLALLLADDPGLRVALAAPTGKAAARLGEAITGQIAELPIDDELRGLIPTGASTLHRLLGYQPRRDLFRHHAGRPLTCDALVIDEASMVDLLLMDSALDALPTRARVVLLGDRDQLASVETGFVFGDLCAAARTGAYSTRFAGLYRRLAGRELPPGEGDGTLLEDAAVELVTSYRFGDQPGIGELARAVRARDAERLLVTLEDPEHSDVDRMDPPDAQDAALEPLTLPLESYLAAPSPAAALAGLSRFRILCARRRGDWGVERMNAVVERFLARRGHPLSEGFYPARPILVTANDYQVRLFNGDLGVCWREAGRLWAFFSAGGDDLRRLPLAKLPPHETAWAMTVHKAQGSEFDHVLLVLGDTDSRVMTRELLYTGATRARRRVVVLGTPEVIRAALARGSRRSSGLVEALAARKRPAPDPEPEPPKDEDGSAQLSLFE